MPKIKIIEFKIVSTQWLQPEDAGTISSILDTLRENGEAEIVDTNMIEKEF
jgi:hypothetical protein